MRILHVIEAVEGGAGLHVRHLASRQTERGHVVAVAGPLQSSPRRVDPQFQAALDAAGVERHEIAFRRMPIAPANAVGVWKLVRIARRFRPDVIHTHNTVGGLFGRLVAGTLRMPAVHTQNGSWFAGPDGGSVAVAARAIERLVAPFTSAVISVSEGEADVYRTVHRPDRVVVIPNGIPVGDEPPAPFPDPPVVAFVARFQPPKDPVAAVRIMAAARRVRPDTTALLVGYGEMEPEVRAAIAALDPGIELRPDLSGAEAVAGATVTLLCTHREGLPYVPLEAMERSRPVVGSDVVGVRDVIVDGETGYLVPPDDDEAGTAAVVRLLADPALARKLGAAGRERIVARFSVEAMVAAVDDVYARVVAARPRRK